MNGVDAQIDRYLAQVSGALADLPADVREELIEDLPAHFAEVLAEDSGSLEERLGPPETYAAELLAAAGIDRPDAAARRFDIRNSELVRWLRLADRKVGELIGYERSSDFVALLRPAWWILRGWVVGMLLLGMLAGDPGPLPDVGGNAVFGWLFVLPFVVLSVRLGPLLHKMPVQFRPFVVVLGVAAALLIGVNAVMYDEGYHFQRSGSNSGYDRYGHITDVFPVDKYGNPLTEVQLYDQDGNPISIGRLHECPSAIQATHPAHMYPLCHPHASATPTPSASPSATPSPSPSATG
jgi:hypothetical protein